MSVVIDEKYAAECVSLDPNDLNPAFVRYTADLAHWGTLLADAKREAALAELAAQMTSADLDSLARETLYADKKPTEAAIAAWIAKHPLNEQVARAVIEAQFVVDKVRAIYEAIKSKRDMLVGLGAQARAELQGDPMLRLA